MIDALHQMIGEDYGQVGRRFEPLLMFNPCQTVEE